MIKGASLRARGSVGKEIGAIGKYRGREEEKAYVSAGTEGSVGVKPKANTRIYTYRADVYVQLGRGVKKRETPSVQRAQHSVCVWGRAIVASDFARLLALPV